MEPGFTVWLTGKPCSGKTTLANLTTEALIKRGLAVELFDGELLRKELWPELGFSKGDRGVSAKRLAYFCHLFNRNCVNCIVASVSPYKEHREEVKSLLENFIEIQLQASDKALRDRDTQGYYSAADKGELQDFTGVNAPYEEPDDPALTLYTDSDTEEGCLDLITTTLEEMCFIEAKEEEYSEEEKKLIDDRLRSLGYL